MERCLYDTVPYRKKSVTVRTVFIALWRYVQYVSAAFFSVKARAVGAFYRCICFLSTFISSVFGLSVSIELQNFFMESNDVCSRFIFPTVSA
jgi:hypothetical protein